jgi:Rrf2 family protein
MAANTRFAVALHLLAALGYAGEARSSEELGAGTVGTHPVVLRRILSRLVKAGLVEAQAGRSGGFRLSRPPAAIDLAAVYRAVEDDGLFAVHENAVVKSCPVSVAIRPVLTGVFDGAESAVKRYLAGKRLSDLLDRIPRRSSRPDT